MADWARGGLEGMEPAEQVMLGVLVRALMMPVEGVPRGTTGRPWFGLEFPHCQGRES